MTQNNSTNVGPDSAKREESLTKSEPRLDLQVARNNHIPSQASKQPRHSSSAPRVLPQQTVEQDDDIEEIVPVVKSEPISENTATVMSNSSNLVEQQQSMAMYEDRSQLVGMEHYDEHYVGEYEGQYDQGYDSSMMVPQDTGGPGRNSS